MKRFIPTFLSISALLVILAGAIVQAPKKVRADEIYLTDKASTWTNYSDNTDWLDVSGANVTDGHLIANISWISPLSNQQSINSTTPGFNYSTDVSTTAFIDDDNDTETPEVEYILKSETYILEGTFNDYFEVYFSNVVSSVSVIITRITDATSITHINNPYGDDTQTSFSENVGSDSSLILGFAGFMYEPDGASQFYPSTGSDILNQTYPMNGTFSVFGTDRTDGETSLTIEFRDSFDSQIYSNFVSTGYEIDFGVAGPIVTLDIDSGPTVVGDDVTITGHATSQGGAFYIDALYYYINAGGLTYMPAADGAYDEATEEFNLTLTDLTPGSYTMEFYAGETDGNVSYSTEAGSSGPGPDIVNFDIEEQAANPEITITSGPLNSSSSYIYVEGNVTDSNGDVIDTVYFELDGGESTAATAVDGTFDSANEDFIIGPYGPYQNGTLLDLIITAENTIAETDVVTYTDLNVQNSIDFPNCVLSNHPTPTSDNTPSHTVTCTSPDKIMNMDYRIHYADELSPQVNWTAIDSSNVTAGGYGTNTVTAVFQHSAPLEDGLLAMSVNAFTESGRYNTEFLYETFPNYDADSNTAMDVFVIEAVDDSAPTIKLNPILPNPITSTAPYITGSCQDVNAFDTNSTIATLQYRLDGGSWVNITPLNAPLDSAIEDFSFQMPEQPLGTYQVDVRCIDSAGHDTNSTGGNQTLNFEIISQPDVEPEEIVITEDFTDNDLNSVNETTAVWGNGYIRLREEIEFDKTIIDSSNYPNRYENVFSAEYPLKGYGDQVWYAKRTSLFRHNTSTNITTTFANVSPSGSITDLEYFESGGQGYVLAAAGLSGLRLLNVDTGVSTDVDVAGLDSSSYTPHTITRDTRNTDLGFYVVNSVDFVDDDASMYYLDLNGTPTNSGDDTYVWYASTIGFTLDDINRSAIDFSNNILYLSQYATGLIRIDDNGTPLNLGDDTRTLFDSSDYTVEIGNISGLSLDPTTGDLFISLYRLDSELLYLDNNGTISNPADDTIVQIGDEFDLFQQTIDRVVFVNGPQYVGGQMFLVTRTGKIIYYNTNGTYADDDDDTSIILETNETLYPEYISGIYMSDYNTIYANFQRTGMTRVDLNRSWEDTGDAVTITIPPEVRLFVNNINLEDVDVGPLLEDEDGSQQANNDSVGIQYFISLDDGITYTEVTPGQLNYILEQDYRLKLKITLTKIGLNSQTPIIDGFTIAYAAYQDEEQSQVIDHITVTTPDTNFQMNENFTITVTAYDTLGYVMQDLDGTVNLQLQYFDTSTNVSALTPVTLNMNNGVGTVTTAKINQIGEYKIVATLGSETDESDKLTVVEIPDEPEESEVTPTLVFVTDKVNITKGESATLIWNSTNLASLVLNGVGNVLVNGSLTVSPTVTTTYIMTGTDTDGDTISAGLTIIVSESTVPVSDEGEVDEDDEESPGVGTGTETSPLVINVPNDLIEVEEGDKVKIEWSVDGDPDNVFIDYQNSNVTESGFFEFYPSGDTTITITARKGTQVISKTITVRIIRPMAANVLLPALLAAGALAATSFVNGGFFHYISIFVGFVIFRRKKYWGVVYNASRMNKIPFATVRIYKRIGNQKIFVTQTITDLEGKYGIPLNESGEYVVEFIHEGYRTEIRELNITRDSDIVLDVGMFEIEKKSLALFTKFRLFVKEQSPAIMQFLRVVVLALMVIGAYITIQVISVSPSVYNYIVLVLYLVAIFVQLVVMLRPMFGTTRGRVLEIQTNKPIKGAVFRILTVGQKATNGVETLAMTNESGVLKIRIQPGMYNYQISRSGFETAQGKVKIDEAGKIMDTIFIKRIALNSEETQKFGQI